ncbi:MAG: hypothetical protein HY727_16970 [Candidatus Rokubacteria bacterium]|nr:hypothetical protein [Candidatus Rokubacteria bacterium]
MNRQGMKHWSVLVLAVVLMAGVGQANAADATLYEVTENMSIGFDGTAVLRLATAALQGTANLGTPLCSDAVLVTNPKAQSCTVTAIGSDSVDLATGLGSVGGTYAVVVQGDNNVDAPEFVVQTGTFTGSMDLSLAVLGIAPLGFITNGTFTIDQAPGVVIPFSGTFRLPFSMSGKSKTTPQKGKDAFYLGDTGTLIKVGTDEKSLGIPTVRFEVTF